jgi:DNA-binding transcriptional ArsR family regulator
VKAFRDLMQKAKHDLRDRLPQLYSQDLLNNPFHHPCTKIGFIERELGVSHPTAGKYLEQPATAGLVRKQKMGRTNFYSNDPLCRLLGGVALEPERS